MRAIGVSPYFKSGIKGVPFRSDLLTWHKGISDNDFAEKINTPPLDAKFLPAIAAVDGTSQLQFTDLSGVSITSSSGTSTPSVSGNNIVFTAGTCCDLLLDDDTFIPDVYTGYDTADSNDPTVVNITKTYSLVGSLHKKVLGYSLYQKTGDDDIQVPFMLTGVGKTSPTVPVGYTHSYDLAGGSKWNMADAMVDFAPASYTAAIPIITDGNTKIWFDYHDLTTITIDGANRVSRWNDKLGSGRDLIQATGADQPLLTADGVLFDGVSEYMKCVGFVWVQPEMIYMVARQITWTLNDDILDGNTTNSGLLQQGGITPQLAAFAGAASTLNGNLLLNSFGIIRILFNGAASTFQINETAQWGGNLGVSNMNGFTLATRGAGGMFFSHIEVKEIFGRAIVDTAPNQADLYTYLNEHNELGL